MHIPTDDRSYAIKFMITSQKIVKQCTLIQVRRRQARDLERLHPMSLQQIKAKLLAVGLLAVSASGTLALFGSVPAIAKITFTPPFSIDKIQAFLIQQADFSTEPDAIRQTFTDKIHPQLTANPRSTANSGSTDDSQSVASRKLIVNGDR